MVFGKLTNKFSKERALKLFFFLLFKHELKTLNKNLIGFKLFFNLNLGFAYYNVFAFRQFDIDIVGVFKVESCFDAI